MDPRLQAYALILHLVEAAGEGGIPMKTALYKAFYWAHVFYYRKTGDLLTRWEVSRMPDGPGIDAGPDLLADLTGTNLLATEPAMIRGYPSQRYRLGCAYNTETWARKEPEYREAVRAAWEHVKGRTAGDLSEETHVKSRTWKDTPPGMAIDIVRDAMTEEEVAEAEKALRQAKEEMGAVWGNG